MNILNRAYSAIGGALSRVGNAVHSYCVNDPISEEQTFLNRVYRCAAQSLNRPDQFVEEHAGALLAGAGTLLAFLVSRTVTGCIIRIGLAASAYYLYTRYSKRMKLKEFKEKMCQWCDAVSQQPEFPMRREALQRTLICMQDQSEHLDLVGLNLSSLPPGLENLKHLKEIYVSRIGELPEALLGKVKRIETVAQAEANPHLKKYHALKETLKEWRDMVHDFEWQGRCEVLSRILTAYIRGNANTLVLNDNFITFLPSACINKLLSLEYLFLENNWLTSLEGLHLPNLRGIYADHNAIQMIGLNMLPNLEVLILNNNQLQAVERLFFPQLRTLDISANQITTLRNLELPQLSDLDARGNPIRVVDPSLASLPSGCTIHFSNAPNADAFAQASSTVDPNFGPALDLPQPSPVVIQPALTPEEQVKKEIDWWKQQYRGAFNSEPPIVLLPLLNSDQQKQLAIYLGNTKLQQTQEMQGREDIRKNFIKRILVVLHNATANEQFREKLLELIQEAQTNCADRASNTLIKIEIYQKILCEQLNDREFAKVLIGQYRSELINSETAKRVDNNENLETALAFQIALREELELPHNTQEMLHGRVACVEYKDAVKNAVLEKTQSIDQKVAILTDTSPGNPACDLAKIWRNRLEERNPQGFLRINSDYYSDDQDIPPGIIQKIEADYEKRKSEIPENDPDKEAKIARLDHKQTNEIDQANQEREQKRAELAQLLTEAIISP